MTVIKQKSVSSDRYAKNVRKYINGKHALARDEVGTSNATSIGFLKWR